MNVFQCLKHGWTGRDKACPQCSGEAGASQPQGISRTFPPGAGVYRGPPMVFILQEEYDLMRSCVEATESMLDQTGTFVSVECSRLVKLLNELADFRKRRVGADKVR